MCAHAASRRKNHRMSSFTLNQVFTKWSRTAGSKVQSPGEGRVLGFLVLFLRVEGGHSRRAETIRRKCETWNWGGCLLSPVRVREEDRCFCSDIIMSRADFYRAYVRLNSGL